MSDTTSKDTRGPSRRTVVRTAAWSVPAIQIAVAAPAFANSKSTADDVVVPGSVIATKLANDKQFQFSFRVFNDGPSTVNVTLTFTATVSPKWNSIITVPAGWTVSPNPLGGNTTVVTLQYVGAVVKNLVSPYETTIVGPTLESQSSSVPIISGITATYTYS